MSTKSARVRELRLSRDQLIAFGDGVNDLAMMAEAGVSIAYHAKPVVREKAIYCFDYVGLDGLLNLYAWIPFIAYVSNRSLLNRDWEGSFGSFGGTPRQGPSVGGVKI